MMPRKATERAALDCGPIKGLSFESCGTLDKGRAPTVTVDTGHRIRERATPEPFSMHKDGPR